MFHRESVIIERLGMTLGGLVFDVACQGLTAGPLTRAEMSRKFEFRVNSKVTSQKSLSSLMLSEALPFQKKMVFQRGTSHDCSAP